MRVEVVGRGGGRVVAGGGEAGGRVVVAAEWHELGLDRQSAGRRRRRR